MSNNPLVFEQSLEAAESLRSQGVPSLGLGLILGSGLGPYADSFQSRVTIPYEEVPHMPVSSVEGHAGAFVFGTVHGVSAIAMQGRVHGYEGHSPARVAFPVRVLWHLGVRTLIVTNASGGIDPALAPGSLVCITDHINMTGGNPLTGVNDERFGDRFPDMSTVWTPRLIDLAEQCAQQEDVQLGRGVYAGVSGPTYETPAEVKMLRTLGGDIVGMSTVFEAIAASHMGMALLGVSCVTNHAAGVGEEALDHADVQRVAARAHKHFRALIDRIVERWGEDKKRGVDKNGKGYKNRGEEDE